MKKSDLLLAGAMLFGFGATAQAQEQLFFFGFEDGMASFTDSTNALDSITELQYYAEPGSNGASLKPEEWELGPKFDTLLYVLNGIQPLTQKADGSGRADQFEIVEDLDGQHKGEFAQMGAQGGDRYFRYVAGPDYVAPAGQNPTSGECLDYEANLFVRALPIKEQTSYRLSMYTKSSSADGIMTIDLMSGFYNSESPFSLNGESGGEFRLVKRGFTTDRWERVTMMSYFQNDSIANRHTYTRGYWWVDEWNRVDADGKNYNYIVMPSQYFVRLSFTGHGATYFVDDMALTESWIAGAEYYQNIMRVDFGYDTNLAELCNATPQKAIKLPAEYFKISGTDNLTGEYFDELVVSAAEYHNDGYLYLWIDEEDSFDYYEDVKVSFTNPEDKSLQLKYDGDLYPMALDTNWVNAGRIVPDFAGEPAFFNPSVSALSMEQMPPVYQSSNPEDGSFNLPTDTRSFDVTFNKNVFVKLNQYDAADTTSVIAMMKGAGTPEAWIPTAYNAETYTVTFSRLETNTSPLAGDYEFDIVQARATARSPQAEKKTIALSFGTSEEGAKTLVSLNFDEFEDGVKEIEGLSVNGACMMAVTSFTGAYEKALKFGLYGVSLGSGAPVMTYTFNVTEPGMGVVKFGTSGCLKNSWNDGCKMEVTLLDPSGNVIGSYTEDGTENKPEEGGNVDKADDLSIMANLSSGEHKLVFTLPNEQSYGGGHQGGRVLYYIEVVKQPAAFTYNKMYTDAMDAAKAVVAKAEANNNYTGSYLNDFKALIASKEGFSSTAPSAYNKTVEEINDGTNSMNVRIANVDNYTAAYTAIVEMETLFNDSIGYNEMEAFAAVKKAVADYATLDIVAQLNDDLNKITDGLKATTQAMTDRCAIVDEFDANIADAIAALEEQTSFAQIAEYKALQSAYNANKDAAKFTITDDELKAVNTTVSSAIGALNNKIAAANALTSQVKALAEMAEALEVNFGAIAEDLNAQLAVELEDNQALANVYKLGIKGALETMMAGEGIDEAGMDMTNFIQNSILYAGIKGYSTPDYMGQPHNGGNAVKFSDKFKSEPEKILPGWTIEA
ncbi:MAG: hypothetical protein J6Q19_07990, partial [Bacteroidaceae bacterium]|nr:hypothetical protein [Bacteroidaceae bacterium]